MTINAILIAMILLTGDGGGECVDEPNKPSGEEIVCPGEDPVELPELTEMGLNKFMVVDGFECKLPSKNIEGLWCEYRLDEKTGDLYLIIYIDEKRLALRAVIHLNIKTGEKKVMFDSEKAEKREPL